MPKVKDLPFNLIPNQSALYLEYLNLSPAALRFYQQAPTLENLINQCLKPSFPSEFPRSEMASILRMQNESYGCSALTMRRIDTLERSDSVAILTGQQVGLFGGPLYTIYKAITAIRIAEELQKEGIPAVAIFWMEGEDHDLAEVTRCTVFDRHGGPQTIDYRKMLYGEADITARSVGSITFPENIREVVSNYLSYIPDTKWKPEVQSMLESAYRPGVTFTQAFAHLLTRIFHETGLILYDPQSPQAKRLAANLSRKVLIDSEAIYRALAQRDRELHSAGFHSQVRIWENTTLLFLIVEGERRALERTPAGFAVKNSNHLLSLEELLELAERNPEKFSPNVLFRPVVQDHLFPTIAYVAGSSELAYFAQTEVLYQHFGRGMPVLWPRSSLTLIEPEIGSIMQRLGIDFRDCFLERKLLMEKVIRNAGFSQALGIIDRLHSRLDNTLAELDPELKSLDATLAYALQTARRKVLHNTESLKGKILRLEALQNSAFTKAIDLFQGRCFPNHNLQEREFSIHPFFALYGPSFPATLLSATEIANFSHRLLCLENES